jgi:hypothetical protein
VETGLKNSLWPSSRAEQRALFYFHGRYIPCGPKLLSCFGVGVLIWLFIYFLFLLCVRLICLQHTMVKTAFVYHFQSASL